MANRILLPHEKLVAYRIAVELLGHVQAMDVGDVRLRDQVLRSARSVCLNIAEGAGRFSEADKKRVYAIARGECCETAAAIELAITSRDCHVDIADRARETAGRVYALVTGLLRRYDFETLPDPKTRHASENPNSNTNASANSNEHEHEN